MMTQNSKTDKYGNPKDLRDYIPTSQQKAKNDDFIQDVLDNAPSKADQQADSK